MLNKANKKFIIRCAVIICSAAVFILVVSAFLSLSGLTGGSEEPEDEKSGTKLVPKMNFEVALLDISKYSRPGIALKKVNGVVVHYTANPGTDAIENRNYFNNLKSSNKGRENKRYASAHFIIGLKGNIVQCIPLSEMAYASNDRNSDTIAIECCHPKKNGKFSSETYEALVRLLTYLSIRYDLSPGDDIIRHYDVTGKECPLYYVKHPDLWEALKNEVTSSVDKTRRALDAGTMEADEVNADGTLIEKATDDSIEDEN